ncbi:MAG TPA: DUF4190 domain-containing protein [Candidatus Angelobacter sp.]|nr:DUF4190 domain-containing protein [Candidatus Angelobacter sp.]
MPLQTQIYTGAQQTDGKAVASLILGIVSIVFCLSLIAGIPAVILGHLSKSNIAKSMGRLKGDGMATAGLIMGYISVAFIPAILIIAAIAIPNLLRAKIAANESGAASTVRTVNIAQTTYSTTYPAKGYAPVLSTLGPGPSGVCEWGASEAHACLLDRIPVARCGIGVWCLKNGYSYLMIGVCSPEGTCSDYVIFATPSAYGNTGYKTFCSTSDGIVRVKNTLPGAGAFTADECRLWPPIT